LKEKVWRPSDLTCNATEFKTTFPIKGGQGWGDRKAVLASKISAENGFLKQDTLYVEAEIAVKKITWNL
jgi:hypothetical protein